MADQGPINTDTPMRTLIKEAKTLFWDEKFLITVVIYTVIYFVLLPAMNVAGEDDFGYYENIIKLLQHKRLVTSDWLAPFSLILTLTSTSTYLVTHNFYLSTYGVMFLCSIANLILIYLLLRKRIGSAWSSLVSFLIVTFPTYLGPSVTYTSHVPTVTLFLLAITMYEKGRILLFFLFSTLAVANRQNMIVLMILPLWSIGRTLLELRKIQWRWLAPMLGSGLITAALILLFEPSYARANTTDKLLENLDPVLSLQMALTGLLLSISFITYIRWLLGAKIVDTIRKNLRRPFLPTLVSVLVGVLFFVSQRTHVPLVYWDIDLFLQGSHITCITFTIFAVSAWLFDYNLVGLSPYTSLLVGFIFLASLWGVLRATYAFDFFFASLLIAVKTGDAKADHTGVSSKVTVAILISINILMAYNIMVISDQKELNDRVNEDLLRTKRIAINQISSANFGFAGWKLFDYFITHDGMKFNSNYFVKGHGYLNPESGVSILYSRQVRLSSTFRTFIRHILSRLSKRLRPIYQESIQDGDVILWEGSYSIGFIETPFTVVRRTNVQDSMKKALPIEYEEFCEKIYPLNNQEWISYIRSCVTGN